VEVKKNVLTSQLHWLLTFVFLQLLAKEGEEALASRAIALRGSRTVVAQREFASTATI
jgi:hypothetical protein